MYLKVLGFVPIKMRCKVHSFVWCLQSFPLKLVHALATSLTWVQIHKIGLDITSKIYERQASIDRTTDVCFLLMSMQYELYISVILFIEWVDETRNSFCWFWACWVKCPSIYLLTNTPRIRWYIMNVICKDNHSKTYVYTANSRKMELVTPFRWSRQRCRCIKRVRLARVRKVGCSNPGCYRPKSFKPIVTAPLPSALQQVLVSRVFRDDHINGRQVSQ